MIFEKTTLGNISDKSEIINKKHIKNSSLINSEISINNKKSKLTTKKLGDLGKIVGGSTPSTKDVNNYGGDIPWITPKDMASLNSRYISKGKRNITKNGFKSCSTVMLPKNSILFSSRAPIGYMAINTNKICTNQGFKSIIPNENIDCLYLYYALIYNMKRIKNYGSGTTFKEISSSVMNKITIDVLEDVKQQKKTSKILDLIDSKIEENISINNNLVYISKLLYKQWFIDFEFPNEKGKSYKTFSGKMVDSELGYIPENWDIGFINDGKLTKIIKSGVKKFEMTKKYIATADVDEANIKSFTTIKYNLKPSRANMTPISNSIWFAKMQDSVKNIIVDSYMTDILDNYIFSTGFIGIKCLNNSLYYMWNYINSDTFKSLKNNLSTGTLMAGISNTTIVGCKYVIPSKKILNLFNIKMQTINKKIYKNNLENITLKNLRDTLLTKLMNGEIDLDNIEL
ncbi:MAG: restriction endonuclease subunit S [Clostridia bacterium]